MLMRLAYANLRFRKTYPAALAVPIAIAVLATAVPASAQTSSVPADVAAVPTRAIDTAGLAAALPYAASITPDELRELAFALASDRFQGRETGTEGQRLAARYLAGHLSEMGLPRVGADDGYEQPIALEQASWEKAALDVGDDDFDNGRDYYAFPSESYDIDIESDDVLYLGYGIKTAGYDDYARAGDLNGRVAVVLAGEPFRENGTSLITGSRDTSAWSADDSRKRAAAEEAGLAVLLIVEPEFQRALAANRSRVIEPGMEPVAPSRLADDVAGVTGTNVLHVSPKVFEAMLGKRRRRVVKTRQRIVERGALGRPVKLPREVELKLEVERERLEGSNVLAYFPGTDPAVADELVVVSAHYDHLGTRGTDVFYGADDNASGSSTVMEIAEAFDMAHDAGDGPRRSVLVLWVSGEEKGLLGSQYYADHPVFPLETTVADINIDMIGRYDEAHADSSAYIYVIGAGRISPDLDSVTQAMNRFGDDYALDYTFDAEDDPNRFYFRSDHYNFAKSGIPSVFFFSGVHEDYHRPGDTPDKLDYDKMATVGRHAFLIAWNLANRQGDLNRK